MEVIVIGAGIIGLTTAQALLADGHKVTVLEKSPGAAEGVSYANGGFIAPAYCVPFASPDLPRQAWDSLFNARSPLRFRPDGTLSQWRWLGATLARCNADAASNARHRFVRLGSYSHQCLRNLVAVTGVQFDYSATGVLQLVRQPDQQTRVERQAEALTAQGFPARWLNREELLSVEPGLLRSRAPLAGALHVSGEASGDCRRFCLGLHKWLAERGVDFAFNQHVTGLLMDGKNQRVWGVRIAGQADRCAQAVVVATGHAPARLLKGLVRLPIQPVKGYTLTASIQDSEHAPKHALLDEFSRLAVVRFNNQVRLAGVAELAGFNLRSDPLRLAQLSDAYNTLYPDTLHPASAGWCGLRPATPDGPPIISATPVDGLWLNLGHGGYGWTLSCGSARLIADLIQGRAPAIAAADFALQRFGAT